MRDLKGFLTAGGTIFFVVYFDNNGNNEYIYYKTFLPFELIPLITNNKDKNSCSIEFKPFPDDASSITDILINFAKHMEMQSAIKKPSQLYSLEDVLKRETIAEINIPLTSHKPIDDPIDHLFNHESYVYATTPAGFHIPIDHFDKISLAQSTQKKCISIDDTIYYDKWEIVYEEKCTRYIIGKSFSMSFIKNNKSLKFNFKLRGTLSEQITDGEFFLALIDNGGFYVNGTRFPFPPDKFQNFNKEKFKQVLYSLYEARKTLQAFDVTEDLKIEDLNDTEYRMLCLLISAYNGNDVHLTDIGQPFGFIKIGNLKILISTNKNEQTGLFRIYNFFEAHYRLIIKDDQNKMHIAPLCLGLKKYDFVECSNINPEKLLKDFSTVKYDEIVSQYVTLWLLEIIKAYDLSKKQYLLETAHKIVESIKLKDKYMEPTTVRLNELQIVKRKRSLDYTEKADLYHIINNCDDDNIEAKIGSLILLDEREEANNLLSGLSKEQKNYFLEYPIYTLLETEN